MAARRWCFVALFAASCSPRIVPLAERPEDARTEIVFFGADGEAAPVEGWVIGPDDPRETPALSFSGIDRVEVYFLFDDPAPRGLQPGRYVEPPEGRAADDAVGVGRNLDDDDWSDDALAWREALQVTPFDPAACFEADRCADGGRCVPCDDTRVEAAAPAPPRIVCPAGWAAPEPDADVPCVLPARDACPIGFVASDAGCVPTETPCPGGDGFPTDVPADAVFVRAGAIAPYEGTRARPFASLHDAITSGALGASRTVALAGEVAWPPSGNAATLHVIGACPAEATIRGPVFSDSSLTLERLELAGAIATSSTAVFDRVVVEMASDDRSTVIGRVSLRRTALHGGLFDVRGRLDTDGVVSQGAGLDAAFMVRGVGRFVDTHVLDPIGRGFRCESGGDMELVASTVRRAPAQAVSAQGCTARLEDVAIDAAGRAGVLASLPTARIDVAGLVFFEGVGPDLSAASSTIAGSDVLAVRSLRNPDDDSPDGVVHATVALAGGEDLGVVRLARVRAVDASTWVVRAQSGRITIEDLTVDTKPGGAETHTIQVGSGEATLTRVRVDGDAPGACARDRAVAAATNGRLTLKDAWFRVTDVDGIRMGELANPATPPELLASRLVLRAEGECGRAFVDLRASAGAAHLSDIDFEGAGSGTGFSTAASDFTLDGGRIVGFDVGAYVTVPVALVGRLDGVRFEDNGQDLAAE